MKKIDGEVVGAIIALCILLVGFGLIALQPYFEMRAFNKFSKVKATYWDAVWTTLRVTPQEK